MAVGTGITLIRLLRGVVSHLNQIAGPRMGERSENETYRGTVAPDQGCSGLKA